MNYDTPEASLVYCFHFQHLFAFSAFVPEIWSRKTFRVTLEKRIISLIKSENKKSCLLSYVSLRDYHFVIFEFRFSISSLVSGRRTFIFVYIFKLLIIKKKKFQPDRAFSTLMRNEWHSKNRKFRFKIHRKKKIGNQQVESAADYFCGIYTNKAILLTISLPELQGSKVPTKPHNC